MEQSLENIRILDFTRVLAGPFATQVMADLGAEVIKVESLDGDESRSWPPTLNNGESGYFCILNRNKKSITLNLKDRRGQEIAANLAATADVVIENFTPGVAKRLSIDYETLSKANPGLVYCSISGFGQYGPYRNRKAYDPIIQGVTGLMSVTGEKDRPPVKIGVPVTDLVAGLYAVIAVQAALMYRMKTGKGQYIDLAMYDAAISILTDMAAEYFATGKAPGRNGLEVATRVPAKAYLARDGRYVWVLATNAQMYGAFCRVLDLPELAADERYDNNIKRVRQREVLTPIFEERMLTRDSQDWMSLFEEADLPCGLIQDLEEVFSDPHLAAREMIQEIEHPVAGLVGTLGFPYKFSITQPCIRSRPPLLGEHTREVLARTLKYGSAELEALKADNVISEPDETGAGGASRCGCPKCNRVTRQ